MGVYVRTGRHSGASLPWTVALFAMPFVVACWMLVLCFYVLNWAVVLSIQFYKLAGAAIAHAGEESRKS